LYIDKNRALLVQIDTRPFKVSELRQQADRITAGLLQFVGNPTRVAIGIDSTDGGLETAWLAKQHAETAVRSIGRSPAAIGNIAVWSELGIDALLLRLPASELSMATVPKSVQMLVQADKSGKLVETLRSYLDHGGSISATAEALHMHRTSLYYRLDQIRSATGLDLDNGQNRLKLHVGLHLLALVSDHSEAHNA